jgi:hypothetical protein
LRADGGEDDVPLADVQPGDRLRVRPGERVPVDGAIHEGNGSMQSVIDERAPDPQRRTLVAILQGEGADPGAVMFQIYRTMCVTPRRPAVQADPP